MGKYLKKHLVTIILYSVLLIGLCLLLYPGVSDWWNSFHQSRAVASYVEAVEDMDAPTMEAMLEEAREYNERLSAAGNHFLLSEEETAEYESMLDFSGTGIMGYVQIPKINVTLLVYHGVRESVLQIAAGHIAGSSLPVGGESTHCVLSGHRGLPSAKLFTDLDKLSEGDIFTVTALNQTITYEVDQVRIVMPDDLTDLETVPGEDLCTLVTCTPYGINTHRMLVRGKRTTDMAKTLNLSAEATRIPSGVVIPAVAVPILFVLLLILLIYYHVRKPPKTQEEWLNEFRQ